MSSVLRNFRRSSIFRSVNFFDRWSKINQCVLCHRRTTGTPWCKLCRADLPRWDSLQRLNFPFIDSATVSFKYSYPLDRLIQFAKYRSNYGLTTALVSLMPEFHLPASGGGIYPVPISKWKLLSRGFNQTSVLAREKPLLETWPIDEVSIHKRSFLPDQSTLDAADRKANAKNLFHAHEFKSAKHAVIVDDVITTGATVSAVAKILRSNGALRVDAYALAAVL